MTTYNEVVEIDMTFKQPGGNSATSRLVFVVVKGLRSKLMIGCPTLDAMSFATSYDFLELRAFDLTIPAFEGRGSISRHADRRAGGVLAGRCPHLFEGNAGDLGSYQSGP